eukprot:g4760.t1
MSSISNLQYRMQEFMLESDFLHIPVESLSRSFRRSQRYVEKHVVATQRLASRAKSAEELRQIRIRIEKLGQNLKKLEDEEEKYLTQLEERVKSMSREETSRDLMSTFVCDFLARSGKFDCARKIAIDQGLDYLVDTDLWHDFHTIRSAILNQDCKSALKWCDSNASKLRRLHSDFPFRLHVQTFLEQARCGDVEEAIRYAQKNVSPYVKTDSQNYEQRLRLSRRAMSCLIFSGEAGRESSQNYSDLLSERRWKDLSIMFEKEFRRVYGCAKHSSLRRTLEAGLAAIRTPKCSKDKHKECPGCDENLGRVASFMPYFRPANTRIVCPMSGKIMNEANPPMAMPSGHVYSLEAIKTLTNEEGFTKCPVTGVLVPFHKLKHVYIM